MALALVGVVYRRRASRVWSWTLYLSFLFTLQVLTTARPDIFFTWHVWVAKESVAALLATTHKPTPGGRSFRRIGRFLMPRVHFSRTANILS